MDDKVVIFCSFTEELNFIYNEFKTIGVMHNGEMSSKQKQNSVDKFQNDEKVKVFVGDYNILCEIYFKILYGYSVYKN